MCNLYLDGKHELLANVPHPNPMKLDSYHSYLSITDMIGNFLSLNVDMHKIWLQSTDDIQHHINVSCIYDSQTVVDIMMRVCNLYGGEKVLVLIGIEFSDDFDPYTTKTNRQSVWVKILRISPSRDRMHIMITTYPLSFGLKGQNHQIVEQEMLDELDHLKSQQRKNSITKN